MVAPVNTSMKYLVLLIFVLLILATIILVTTIVFKIVDTIPSVFAISTNYSNYNYLEQVQANYDDYNNSLWSLGNGIAEGDYFVYKICNDNMMYQIIYPYHCYVISLEFVKILESYNGDVWIVQSYFTIDGTIGDTIGDNIYDTIDYTIVNSNNTSPLILLIDPYTFHVTTDPFNKKIGESLENTIFSLSTYGKQSLSIGIVWDEIDSYFTNKIPLEIKNKQTIEIFTPSFTPNSSNDTSNYTSVETSVLSYDIIVPSNVYLHNDFPFPLKAELYSPHVIYPKPQELYYFELVDYQSGYQSGYQSDNLSVKIPTILTEDEK